MRLVRNHRGATPLLMWNCTQRLAYLLIVLVRHAAAHHARPLVDHWAWLARRLPPTGLSGPARLSRILEDLGGSFIKLGQMMAMQPDILPLAYCDALNNLLDHISPIDPAEIERVIREETGRGTADLFERFNPIPLASGSIGQVHEAWIGRQKLAVKVQRPDTQKNFDRDVNLMSLTVTMIRVLRLRALSFLIDPLTEFAAWTREELDFRREASHMRKLRKNIDESQYIPAVLDDYSTRRVLVVEFLEGITLMDHLRALERRDPAHEERLEAMGFAPAILAQNIIENCLGNVFQFGVFHADLHPANLMILPGNVVGYIDFGITGVISRYSRQNLLAMTLAYARKDVESLCNRFFAVSSLDERSDPQAFRAGVKRLSEQWYTADPKDPRLKLTTTQVMLDMLRLSREACIWPQRDIIKYIRSAIAIDGLVRRFAPDFDFAHHLGAACRRHLTSHARRMLLSHDVLFNFTNSWVDLLRDGMFRFAAALEQAAETPRDTAQGESPGRRSQNRFSMEMQLLIVLALALAAAFRTHQPLRIGLNVSTAELLVASVAVLLLVTSRRARLISVAPHSIGR